MKQPCRKIGWPKKLALATIVAAAATAATVHAADWPLIRGNILGSGVADTPLKDDLDVLWKYHADKDAGFDATAVGSDGVVYVGDTAGTIHAVRLNDGKPVWTKSFEDTGFGAGAAVDKDRLYIGDDNGIVHCLSTADGSE